MNWDDASNLLALVGIIAYFTFVAGLLWWSADAIERRHRTRRKR